MLNELGYGLLIAVGVYMAVFFRSHGRRSAEIQIEMWKDVPGAPWWAGGSVDPKLWSRFCQAAMLFVGVGLILGGLLGLAGNR